MNPIPPTVSVTLQRSVDGGASWETIAENLAPETIIQDFEGLSHGTTTYRAIAYSDIGSTSTTEIASVTESPAIWLGGGPGYATTARLPFNPKTGVEAGRERSTELYDGRPLPVAYAGQHLSRVAKASGVLVEGEQANAARQDLHALAQHESPVHLYRDPMGYRIFGSLSSIPLNRISARLVSFDFTVTETDH